MRSRRAHGGGRSGVGHQVQALEGRLLFSLPPLTAVTDSVSGATISYSVFDPVQNRTVASSFTDGGTISNVVNTAGVLSWMTTAAGDTLGAGYAIYNPNLGAWRSGYTLFPTGSASAGDWTMSAPLNANGVVAWTASNAFTTNRFADVYFATYDPASETWKVSYRSNTTSSSQESISYQGLVDSQGLVAWHFYDQLSGFYTYDTPQYAAYDAAAGGWVVGSSGAFYAVSNVAIGGEAVSYTGRPTATGAAAAYSTGYHASTHAWGAAPTSPAAFFYASPTSAQGSLTTWYWDESQGSTSWSWQFGDGATSAIASGYHHYASPGNYTLTETTGGPGGSSVYSTPVSVTRYASSVGLGFGSTTPTVGQSVTLTATVSGPASPTGTVQFTVDGTNVGSPVALANGAATAVLSGLGSGTHALAASYGGDANLLPSSNSTSVTMANPSGVTPGTGAAYTITSSGGTQTLEVTAGVVTLSSDLSSQFPGWALRVDPGAGVTLGSNQHVAGLTLSGSGWLDIQSATVFDAYTTSDPMATVAAAVATGFAGGKWNGPGIVSGQAATNHLTAVGYADTGSAVEIGYAYFGDANLDGAVNAADYTRIDAGFVLHLTGWFNGDLNYDGAVDGSDYTLVDNAFNQQRAAIPTTKVAPAPATAATAKPETVLAAPAATAGAATFAAWQDDHHKRSLAADLAIPSCS